MTLKVIRGMSYDYVAFKNKDSMSDSCLFFGRGLSFCKVTWALFLIEKQVKVKVSIICLDAINRILSRYMGR
jgi:hypothetical protein